MLTHNISAKTILMGGGGLFGFSLNTVNCFLSIFRHVTIVEFLATQNLATVFQLYYFCYAITDKI